MISTMVSPMRGRASRSVGGSIWQLLTLRMTRREFNRLSLQHFAAGMIGVWIVGMGRWYDDPSAGLMQKMGVGSVVYVFILAAALWVIFAPLQPVRWRYFQVLTMVTLTSFPAILYAIPVETFLPPQTAADANLSFLIIVATWRVAMLVTLLRRYAALSWPKTIAGIAFPCLSLMTLLAIGSLLDEIAETMGGVRSPRPLGLARFLDLFFFSALGTFIWYLVLVGRSHLIKQMPLK